VIKEKCEKCESLAVLIFNDKNYCVECYAEIKKIPIKELMEKNESTTNDEF